VTFEDYVDFVRVYVRNHPEQRPGQAAVNVLRSLVSHAYLADKVMHDLGIDPWDRLDLLGAFFQAVEERW
jgi:phosphoglucomutase